jgi:hypothetical protein
MHAGGTGCDYDMGKFLFLDGLLQKILTWIGTHILVVGGEGNAGQLADFLCNALDIDGPGYVFAAMADEYAYSGHLEQPFLFQ